MLEDVRTTMNYLKKQFPNRRFYAVGFSLGANILCNVYSSLVIPLKVVSGRGRRKFSLRGSFSSLQPMATPPSPRNPNEHLRRTKSLLPHDGRKPQTRLPQTIPHDERPSKSQLGGPEQSALHPRYRSLLLLIICFLVLR